MMVNSFVLELALVVSPLLLPTTNFVSADNNLRRNDKRRQLKHYHGLYSDEETLENSKIIHQWRAEYEHQCHEVVSNSGGVVKEDVEALLHDLFHPSFIEPYLTREDELDVVPCDYTFLDFGANVGDSLGKLIDSGIPTVACDAQSKEEDDSDKVENNKRKKKNKKKNNSKTTKNNPKYSLDDGLMNGHYTRDNKLVRFCRQFMSIPYTLEGENEEHTLYPEQFCYYGVEGNPVFTERLKYLERRAMRSSPRPIRRAHFFTESVGSDVDGPTQLFLDKINTKDNFWGSSIIESHPDVQRTAERKRKELEKELNAHKNGTTATISSSSTVQAADVTGYTLTSLIERTVNKHAITGPPEAPKGPQLLIKMDIEGGEYRVLNEAYDSGVLCDLIQKHNANVYLLLEVHNTKVLGQDFVDSDPHFKRFNGEVKGKLNECGVVSWIGLDAGR